MQSNNFGLSRRVFICLVCAHESVCVQESACVCECVWESVLCEWVTYVTLEHKTSHKCQIFQIEMYASSESWINNISIDVCFMIGQYLAENLESEDAKNLNIENHL